MKAIEEAFSHHLRKILKVHPDWCFNPQVPNARCVKTILTSRETGQVKYFASKREAMRSLGYCKQMAGQAKWGHTYRGWILTKMEE